MAQDMNREVSKSLTLFGDWCNVAPDKVYTTLLQGTDRTNIQYATAAHSFGGTASPN